jgi:glycosidase
MKIRIILLILFFLGEAYTFVKRRVTFKFKPPYPAHKVTLAGTFNGWDKWATPMKKDSLGIWRVTLILEEGIYQYKFVVDGTSWFPDPHSDDYAPDGFGGKNSVIYVDTRYEEVILKRGDGLFVKELLLHDMGKISFTNRIHPDSLLIRFRTASEDVEEVLLLKDGLSIQMKRVYESFLYEYYEAMFYLENPLLLYLFKIRDGNRWLYYGRGGINSLEKFVLDISRIQVFYTPQWVEDAVFYQIFPERFWNGDPANDPPGTKPWKYEVLTPPKGWFVFYGGDLWGIIEKVDHLLELGINAVYLNPIFSSPSNHKYDIIDYLNVDPHFGGNDAFDSLIKVFKRYGIRIILDGVFNHTSDEHPFFQDIVRRGPDSPYWNWYIIKKWPFPEKFDNNNKPIDYYECWWGFGDLPKLNYSNPEVRKYILEIGKYWIERGIDGWRLDVPNEVPHNFWKDFRREIKSVNPDAYLVGEIWGDASPWLEGDEFDAVMNYQLRELLFRFVVREEITPSKFLREFENLYFRYPPQASRVLFNLLSSHDTERFLQAVEGNKGKMEEAVFLLFTLPGTPVIYYGEEVGMLGGGDPDCRRPMIWDTLLQDGELFSYYKKLIRIRKENPALRRGSFEPVMLSPRILSFFRIKDRDTLLILLNSNRNTYQTEISGKSYLKERNSLYELMNDEEIKIEGGMLRYQLEPHTGIILKFN